MAHGEQTVQHSYYPALDKLHTAMPLQLADHQWWVQLEYYCNPDVYINYTNRFCNAEFKDLNTVYGHN